MFLHKKQYPCGDLEQHNINQMKMKRILTMIALAVLTAGLAGSCTKNFGERLDKTDASVADIKAAIGQYENLMGDITSAIEALRAEVGTRPASEQKTIWDCINALQNQKGTFEAAIAALTDLVGDEAVWRFLPLPQQSRMLSAVSSKSPPTSQETFPRMTARP